MQQKDDLSLSTWIARALADAASFEAAAPLVLRALCDERGWTRAIARYVPTDGAEPILVAWPSPPCAASVAGAATVDAGVRDEAVDLSLRIDGAEVGAISLFGGGAMSPALVDLVGGLVSLALRAERAERRVVARADDLAAAAVALKRRNVELQSFALVAAHDLQEPVRKMRAFTDRLTSLHASALDAQGRDLLGRVARAGRRMQELIDGVLAFTRVETRREQLRDVDLRGVLGEALADLDDELARTRGRVEIARLPTIEADAACLRQLFGNLLANALKFTQPDRPPVVRVDCRDAVTATGAPAVAVTVADDGIGFDPRHNEKVFEMLQRLNGRSAFAGSGMGLAICRKIARLHGGEIAAEGAPGRGAVFTVVLPKKSNQDVRDA